MQKKEWVQTSPTPKIHTDEIPNIEFRILGDAISRALEKFYADPKKKQEFEQWRKARKAEPA